MKTTANWMAGLTKQRLSKRASSVFLIIAVGALILLNAWQGRKRLFEHDRQYLLAFILFIVSAVTLVGALKVVAAKARDTEDQGIFSTFQVWTGVLSCLGFALFGLFSDYTLSNLNAGSVVGSIFVGVIFGVWNAASMKNET